MPATERLSPIFCDQGVIYHADTCAPLSAASKRGEVALRAVARGHYPGRRLPQKWLPGLCTCGTWDAPRPQDWGLGWHRNEGIEVTYVERGKLDFAVDGVAHPLSRGHLTITRPWQVHRVGNPNVGASRLHWVILDVQVRRPDQTWRWPDWLSCPPEELRRLTELLRHNEQPVWRAGSDVARCFARLADAQARSGSPDHARLRLHLSELFVLLIETLEHRTPTLDKTLSSVQRSVELFLKDLSMHVDRQWDLPTMAEQCGLGPTRFAYYCQRLTGMSPIAYLAYSRVERAKNLLEKGTSNVTDVALECGFQSSQYFATVFKSYTGVTPREFRRNVPSPRPSPLSTGTRE